MLSFVIWIPVTVYIVLLAFAVVSIIMTTAGVIIVSIVATAAGLYVAKLYSRHFMPKIWLWKIKRWW
jgi:membrane associated rhomboid family serine protease